jgi:N-acetylneuraminate lyase
MTAFEQASAMRRLAGLYAALPSAFDSDGRLDWAAQQAVARHAIGLGVDGLFVGGSTAEVHSLDLAERLAQLEQVADAARGQARLIAHVGSLRLADSLRLARAADVAGYDAVASTTPFYTPYRPAERRLFVERLAGEQGLPVFAYHIPGLTGVPLPVPELLDLLSIGNVVGMKYTHSDLLGFLRLRRERPDATLLFGSDELLALALAAGADGGVGSTYNLFGRHYVEMRRLVAAGNVGAAVALQQRLAPAIDALIEVGVFQGIKVVLKGLGVDCGACRPPQLMPAPAAAEALFARLRPLLG